MWKRNDRFRFEPAGCPGEPGEEVIMQKTMQWVVVAVLLGAIIVIMGSCQQGAATDKKVGDTSRSATRIHHSVEITFDKDTGQWVVPTVEVARTERVQFTAGDRNVWMLFPADFNYVKGNGTFSKTRNLLAVTIPRGGGAVIEVPEYFPNPDINQTIRYSVMMMMKNGDQPEDWQYVHGKNPPPGMTIPKKR
jgi:hypothetical protein